MKTRRIAALLLLNLCLLACATFTAAPLLPVPASPTSYSQSPSPAATLPPPQVVLASLTPTALPDLPPPAYHFQVQLDYAQRTAAVRQNISESNRASTPLTELLLVVDPNRVSGIFELTSVRLGQGDPLGNFKLDKTRLTIPLDPPIAPRAAFTLDLDYTLKLPPSNSWLGSTGRQLNLGDWYPFLPPYVEGKGWLVHDPAPVGEYLVYPAVDYTVDLTLVKTSYRLVVAASAPLESASDGVQHYRLNTARGFAFSVSPEFQTETKGKVTAYFFAEHARAARASLETASSALDLFSERYGPYPYPGLALVEGDFFDGMEYSGLFFLGTDYFKDYPGSPLSYLTPLSAHETAHQWWYSLVGDDPALEPWLDEALCTYSEQLYFEKARPDLVTWWRFYRIDRYQPGGRVDSTIYDHSTFRPYVNAVYLRGAQFLDDLRKQIGDPAFFAFLQELVTRHSGQIVTAADFWSLLKTHTSQDVSQLAGQYFSNPPK